MSKEIRAIINELAVAEVINNREIKLINHTHSNAAVISSNVIESSIDDLIT